MTGPATGQFDTNSDDVNRLVDHSRENGRPDPCLGKRRWTRWATGMDLEAVSEPADQATPWTATMKNVSGGGIALWVRKKFDLGEQVYIREFNPEAPTEWIQGEVIYCRVGISDSLVGVKFDDPAPTDQHAE
ncbi:MAG: PilZ domain-containing protein [bacterium]|nr:PilZ domain-containing protein [bacterium]